MNRKQTIVAWIGAVVFIFFAWNPKIVKENHGTSLGAWYIHKPVFDTSFAAMFGRLSATVVVTSLAIYTVRDKRKDKEV